MGRCCASFDAVLLIGLALLSCGLAVERYEAYRVLSLLDEFQSNQAATASLRTPQADYERFFHLPTAQNASEGDGGPPSLECVDCGSVKLKNTDSWSCARCASMASMSYVQWHRALADARAAAVLGDVCGARGAQWRRMPWTSYSLCSEKRSAAIAKVHEQTVELHWALWIHVAQSYVGWIWFVHWLARWAKGVVGKYTQRTAREKSSPPERSGRYYLEDSRVWDELSSGPLRRRFGCGVASLADTIVSKST